METSFPRESSLKRGLSVCLISVLQCSINFLVPLYVAGYTVSRVQCFQSCNQNRSRGKSSTAHVNTFPMFRWILRRMRDGGWTLLPNDKEPGFCFICHSGTRYIAISSVVPGSHEEWHFLDLWLLRMMNANTVIAKGTGELHGERTKSAVVSSQWSDGATAILSDQVTVQNNEKPWRGDFSGVFTLEHRTCGQVCRHGWHITFV